MSISFLNVNFKILDKILANQVQESMKYKKDNITDQGEFIPGVQNWLNIRKLANTFHYKNIKE